MTSAEAPAALGRYQRAHPGARDRLRQVTEKAAGHPVGQPPTAGLLLVARPRRNCPSPAVTAVEALARSSLLQATPRRASQATDARAHHGGLRYAAVARPTRLAVTVPDDDNHGPPTITNYPPRGK